MADIYGTIEDFRTYHIQRDHDIVTLDDEDIAAALLVASEWIDNKFRSQFPGTKIGGRSQVREWPRKNAYDIYNEELVGVPVEIENATYEAALIQATTPGSLSVNWTPGKYKSVSVDGAISVEYAGISSVFDAQAQFAIINEILSTILTGGQGAVPYVGESIRW